jgi:hypothetical protein
VDRFHSRGRGKNFIEIDPLSLHVALHDESSLVLDVVFILLGLENPLEADRAMSWWELIDLPCLILLD